MADDLTIGEIDTDEAIDLDITPDDGPEEEAVELAAPPEEEQASDAPVVDSSDADTEEVSEEPKVNLGALHEERNKRQELEKKLAAQEEAFRSFQERLAIQQTQVPQPEVPAVPDFDEDPAANLNERLRAQEEQARQLQAQQQEQTEQQAHQRQLQQFDADFRQKEAAFATETPDYYQAVNWLRSQRAVELKGMGYQDKDIGSMVDNEAVQYAITATQNGVDPVTMFYQTAKSRGYSGAKAPPTVPDLAKVAENQKRATSVGTSGQTTNAEVTLQDLANMTDDDFDKYTSGDAWKKYWT